jgi:hypothetical protein
MSRKPIPRSVSHVAALLKVVNRPKLPRMCRKYSSVAIAVTTVEDQKHTAAESGILQYVNVLKANAVPKPMQSRRALVIRSGPGTTA